MTSRIQVRHLGELMPRLGRPWLVPLGLRNYPIDSYLWHRRWAMFCVVLFFGFLLFLGAGNKEQSIVDLLLRGAVIPVSSPPQEEEVNSPPIEVEFTPPPPPEPHPEFIQPKEQPPPQPVPLPEKKPEPRPEMPRTTSIQPIKKTALSTPPRQVTRYAAAAPRVGDANTPKPPYPYECAIRRYQGTVELSLTVVQGRIVSVDIVRSSGFAMLDSNARQWILHRWRLPSTLTGTYTIPIIYRLE
ncbi:Periplasmic protein TonB [Methylacidiphilum infernorum V4]|uniref:Periplasmic protein TonB n=2 Tax=Candidatus Methylacidiphilum infernorum TaxID=511746 RepID=B3E0E9_METI4|nr:Periplasmic protein TonB [Methylacidiphilum infernorum V4]